MPVTAAQFREVKREFDHLKDQDITLALEQAQRSIDSGTYTDKNDSAVIHLAAHLLTREVYGEQARIAPNAAPSGEELLTTTHGASFHRIRCEVSARAWDMRVL